MTSPDLNQNVSLRSTQIRLLDTLKEICDKHGLTYWIDFGTLLGAIRGKDFIPWDDDIDVSMPIEDYRRFLEIAEKELPPDVFLQTPKTDPEYKQYFAKLRDCHSTFIEHHETGDEGYHHGIYIDVFPYVYYPKLPKLVLKVLIYATLKTRENAFVLGKNKFFNLPAYYLCKLIWLTLSPLTGKDMGQTPEDNGYMYTVPDTYLYPLREIEFAGKKYPGPCDPHQHLTVLYKDYMKPTPTEKRVSHAKKILTDTPCKHPKALSRNI